MPSPCCNSCEATMVAAKRICCCQSESLCEVCGFKSSLIRYEADVTEEELLAKVRELNEDADVDGFIVQLPLPKHISEQKVIETIDYRKDVDRVSSHQCRSHVHRIALLCISNP